MNSNRTPHVNSVEHNENQNDDGPVSTLFRRLSTLSVVNTLEFLLFPSSNVVLVSDDDDDLLLCASGLIHCLSSVGAWPYGYLPVVPSRCVADLAKGMQESGLKYLIGYNTIDEQNESRRRKKKHRQRLAVRKAVRKAAWKAEQDRKRQDNGTTLVVDGDDSSSSGSVSSDGDHSIIKPSDVEGDEGDEGDDGDDGDDNDGESMFLVFCSVLFCFSFIMF